MYSERQEKIIDIVKKRGPITGRDIAEILGVTRGALRTDFSVLTKDMVVASKTKIGYSYLGSGNPAGKKLGKDDVSNYMSVPNILSEETTVYEAIVSIFLKDTGSIYVTKDGLLSGVVSRKDLLKHMMGGNDSRQSPIGMIMTRMPNIVYCYKDETIHEAAEKMVEHEIDSLPVVEETGFNRYKVIGKVSKTTITKIFVEEFKG